MRRLFVGRTNRTGLGTRVIQVVLILALLAGAVFTYDTTRPKKAEAQLINFTVLDIQRWIEFFQVEAQEITVDQIRQIVIKEVTKKMIEKIIGGEQGGVAGGGSAFVSDYYQFLYNENARDARNFVDDEFDRQFPSYLDPSLKEGIKSQLDPNTRYVPDNCIDARTIDFRNDPDAINKMLRAAQPGCNELTAQIVLYDQTSAYLSRLIQQAQIEAQANKGLVNKDEESNTIRQWGGVYEGAIQGALEAVYGVQINNESAISSIIGAFVDQLLDELLDQSY